MPHVRIILAGCDDKTIIKSLWLTPEQEEAVKMIEELSHDLAGDFDCMPVLSIDRVVEDNA